MPKEESFPIPLKYIDVTRTTHTSQDVSLEKHIEDDWNVDGERKIVGCMDRLHMIYSIKRKATRRVHSVRWETYKETINLSSR